MKVLVICSYNSGKISPFVREQVNSVRKLGVKIHYFKIRGKGILGYLKNIFPLRTKLKNEEYDFIHAHYGLTGMVAILQRKVPVICTFHGSDVHFMKYRIFSFVVSRLTIHNVLTNKKQIKQLGLSKNTYSIIKCGIDLELFKDLDKLECKRKMHLQEDKRYILFASNFDNSVKNYPLAKISMEIVNSKLEDKIELIELKNFTKEEVAFLINASELTLVTSNYETGPLIVKESLACNTPVVSTNVGDVADLLNENKYGYICEKDPEEIADKINIILNYSEPRNLVSTVREFRLENISIKLKALYDLLAKGKG